MYTYSEVVNQVQGLNSISTLKKWRLLAEKLAGASFYKARNLPLFTQEDIQKFQQVADLKEQLGLDNAVLYVFAPDRGRPMSLSAHMERLEATVNICKNNINTLFRQIPGELKAVNQSLSDLTKRVEQLEEPPKRKRLFGSKR